MAKQVQARNQKDVDEDFVALANESIKKDEKLLKRLGKA